MKLLKKYLLMNYSQTFFPIFLTLYTITSIIFLVKIASLTSIIQINFLELIELYSYSIPTILFYTLPISIFFAIALTLSKLSSEYELIVITSFGLNPIKILKFILPTILLSSLLLLLLSLALIPKADYMKKTFLENKKTEAQFNIKASEYGQAFGKWLIYVNEEDKGIYKDVVLFQQNKIEDTFIISDVATMKNNGSSFSLNLNTGKAFKITDKVNQIDFNKMVINNEITSSSMINNIEDLIEYWRDIYINETKAEDFVFYVLASLYPMISILFALYIGFYNPRYQKNNSTILAISATTFFFITLIQLKYLGLILLFYIPASWVLISMLVYYFKVKPHY
ncbi:MAG: lipopolysaccharide export system permease protein [Arcobacteraceae bacterium]|jgi:lipopolysaccharide export system permease protein